MSNETEETNVVSIGDFKQRKADKAAERERNLAAIPRIQTGGAVEAPGTTGLFRPPVRTVRAATDEHGAPVELPGVNFPLLCELLEVAIHELASASLHEVSVATQMGRKPLGDSESAQALRNLMLTTDKAWVAYNHVRRELRAAANKGTDLE